MINNTTARAKPVVDIAYLPPQKATNKPIFAVGGALTPTSETVDPAKGAVQTPQPNPVTASSAGGGLLQKAAQQPQSLTPTPKMDKPGFGFDGEPAMQATAQSQPNQEAANAVAPEQRSGGLLQSIAQPQPTVTAQATSAPATTATATPAPTSLQMPNLEYKPVGAEAIKNAPTMVTPTTDFKPTEFQKDGYTGAQGNTNFSYKPGEDSLVENRIAGLLDPNSALMRKATAEAAQYAASRGLQSSSIGGEVALSAMVDKAMPIASQDATTFNQAQQLGWQQSWQSGENNTNRTHDASMADKQGKYQNALQNTQLAAQSDENNANRQMQAELQQLQHKQQLGMLDAQGAQRMQEIGAQMQASVYQQERSAQLQTERDKLLQNMSNQTMDKQYLQQLELTKAQYDQSDKTLMAQMNYDTQMKFKNATETALNTHLDKVGNIWADPNMTSEQKKAGTDLLKTQFESHRATLEAIYGFTGATGGGTPPPTGTSNPNPPVITTGPHP